MKSKATIVRWQYVAAGLVLVVLLVTGAFWLGTRNRDSYSEDFMPDQMSMGTDAQTGPYCYGTNCVSYDSRSSQTVLLPQAVQDALSRALQEEYLARASYQKVVDTFGMLPPFAMILSSEDRHVNSIQYLYDKYNLALPASSAQPTAPASFQAACDLGVSIEKADIKLYDDDVLQAVKDYPDMVTVFTNLRNASEAHLAAFEKCN